MIFSIAISCEYNHYWLCWDKKAEIYRFLTYNTVSHFSNTYEICKFTNGKLALEKAQELIKELNFKRIQMSLIHTDTNMNNLILKTMDNSNIYEVINLYYVLYNQPRFAELKERYDTTYKPAS